ncbi:peroxiredoxin [Cellulomonas fimi]|uniref:Alkyl hydroperoxide reductase E n=1 Tax=Cellulomonas fimi (strain ATCC 484 / DSM 20113 / JCM 1341 / CCUG 24087 / LMG 16345 / NBRC 15513 / NCIMB 8980 / NCTC 7547 / NRS-133) TaxID=590998 RepID=F4H291_CELFA|nr:peroxiredoxin [Cellulomonas fimi]AEE46388.1 alkyl hydroperoxide reductase/ Thiol specific antioxidant/ Mal allergen [Cellulomonas fimi ATCC 484]NNH07189.1 peroxiredoxin [Cellulomonas fimi]VEH32797.1 Putative peroxiredoxin Rv2238c/MT2298 [Cellulomonas fimi]
MSGVPSVGDVAPDFTLTDTHGSPVTLSELRGTPVVVVFVPFAFSGTCRGELCEIRDNIAAFDDAGVRVLVVSCDSVFTLRAWREQEGYGFDLLSDFWPHGDVARAYGVFDETHGRPLRGSFLLDAEGVVRWSVVNPAGQARDLAAYRAAIADLTA